MTAVGARTIEYEDGVYIGETIVDPTDGYEKAHGIGKYNYTSGDTYEGEFRHDMMHGKGVYRWSDGTVYDGHYDDGDECGFGIFTDATTGDTYEGNWDKQLRNGHGVSRSGLVMYEGEWLDNNYHGFGKYTVLTGGGYTGEWVEGRRHGKGTERLADGSEYTGEWVDDARHGAGVLTGADGSVYEGQFKNKLFDGDGRYTWPSGTRFEGTFCKGERHGSGKEIHTNGNTYVGTWVHNVAGEDVVVQMKNFMDGVSTDVSNAIREAITTADSANRAAEGNKDTGGPSETEVENAPPGKTSEVVAAVLANLPDELKRSILVTASIRPPPSNTDKAQLQSLLSTFKKITAEAASGEADTSAFFNGSSTGVLGATAVFSSTGRGICMTDLERFTPMTLLGKGSFGAAYEAVLPTGRIVCVKCIELGAADPAALSGIYNEIRLMQRLHHPNIVDFYGCTRDEAKNTLNIFMEYITGGSLVTYARKFKVIPAPTVRRWAYQIVCGVKYLHDNNVIHRDIKGENILMTHDGIIKLADFGCSKALEDVSDSKTQGCNTMVGTPYWMAPEVILCSKDTLSSYGTKADIWSVGCTIVEMITGRPPWPESPSVWRAIYQIANATGPPNIAESIQGPLRDFLLAIFERDPLKRPSADELLRHPYLAGYKGE